MGTAALCWGLSSLGFSGFPGFPDFDSPESLACLPRTHVSVPPQLFVSKQDDRAVMWAALVFTASVHSTGRCRDMDMGQLASSREECHLRRDKPCSSSKGEAANS